MPKKKSRLKPQVVCWLCSIRLGWDYFHGSFTHCEFQTLLFGCTWVNWFHHLTEHPTHINSTFYHSLVSKNSGKVKKRQTEYAIQQVKLNNDSYLISHCFFCSSHTSGPGTWLRVLNFTKTYPITCVK